MKTQTTVKPSKAASKQKPAPKAKPATAPDYVTLFPYAVLLADCMFGTFGPKVAAYFKRAREWHDTMKTQFPRTALCGHHALLPATEAREYFETIKKNGANVCKDGTRLRLYDEMRVQYAANTGGFAEYVKALFAAPVK